MNLPARKSPLAAYDVSARVAHGGMASIYVATHPGDGEEVAVKVLHGHLAEDDHIKRMFLHEARLATQLRHPNVVEVYDQGEDPTYGTFIIMEYIRGADLAGVLKSAANRRRRVDPRVVARIVIDLCRGLHAAHELSSPEGRPLNLVHRDVSPHNILIGDDGVARLTDFGIAKSDERYTMTRPGQLKGKLAYMAPEQLAHEDEPDRRVDVFAAGVVLWEALLTKRLFKGEDEVGTINKVLLSKIEPPSHFEAALAPLDSVVDKALAREPEDRYQTAGEMADALEEAAKGLGGAADRTTCRQVLEELLEDELAKRDERISRTSMTPTAPASGSFSSFELTPDETPPPSGRWVGAAIGALLLLIGVCGTAIAWILLRTPAETVSEPEAPVVEAPPPPVEEEADAPEAPELGPETRAEEPPSSTDEPPREARVPGRTAPAEEPSPYDAPGVGPTAHEGLPPMEGTPNPYGD